MRRLHRFAAASCLALTAALCPDTARAQGTTRAVVAHVLSGEVLHDVTSAPIAGATVVLSTAGPGIVAGPPAAESLVSPTRATLTNARGEYRFDGLAAGTYELRVLRLGFRAARIEVVLHGGDSRVSVGMTVVPVRLQPLEVRGTTAPPFTTLASHHDREGAARRAALVDRQRRYLATDVRELTTSDVGESVTLADADLFRALHRLPGVASRNETWAELWTRNARADRTRVLFDGLPLFDPVHLGGGRGAVNEDALAAAFLHPGVRPAALGEGGAGVLELRSRAGAGAGRLNGAYESTTSSGRLALDQRLAGGRAAWMLAGRMSGSGSQNPEPKLSGTIGDDVRQFRELATRADLAIGGGRALEASALHGRDEVLGGLGGGREDGVRGRWGNDIARLTLVAPVGAWPARHTVGVSRYDASVRRAERWNGVSDPADFPMRTGVSHLTLGSELTAPVAGIAPAAWSAGWELVRQVSHADGEARAVFIGDIFDTSGTRRSASLVNLALWGERRWLPASRLTVVPGVRLEGGSTFRGAPPVRIAPRIVARFAPGDSTVMYSLGAGRAWQYTQALSPVSTIRGSTAGLFPLWLMADGETPPLRTDLLTAGAERWLGDQWHGSVNAWVRRSANVLVPDPRPGPITAQALFVEGRERGQGAELSLRRVAGRWTTALGYAHARSSVEAAGETYPAAEDRRQTFDATMLARLGAGWRLGAAYAAATGLPYTRFDGGERASTGDQYFPYWGRVPTTEAPHAHRMPDYSALDLLASWTGRVWGAAQVTVTAQLHGVREQGSYAALSEYRGCDGALTGCERDGDVLNRAHGVSESFGIRVVF